MQMKPGEGWKEYHDYYSQRYPDARTAAIAAEGLKNLIKYALDPFDRSVYQYNLASLYYQQQQYDKALQEYLSLLEADPENDLAMIGAAHCYLQETSGMYSEELAWKMYAKAERGQPIRSKLGQARILLDNPELDPEGRKSWQLAADAFYMAQSQIDFPYQPFPESAAAIAWFELCFFDADRNFSILEEVLQTAMDVLDQRLESGTPVERDDAQLMNHLSTLYMIFYSKAHTETKN